MQTLNLHATLRAFIETLNPGPVFAGYAFVLGLVMLLLAFCLVYWSSYRVFVAEGSQRTLTRLNDQQAKEIRHLRAYLYTVEAQLLERLQAELHDLQAESPRQSEAEQPNPALSACHSPAMNSTI